jgi:hypothetical protein
MSRKLVWMLPALAAAATLIVSFVGVAEARTLQEILSSKKFAWGRSPIRQ